MVTGILAAIPEEVESILQKVEVTDVVDIAKRQYHIGKLHGHDVVVALSRKGKVAAGITASTMITQFAVKHIISTGVAGAVDDRLNIGDIVIADALYQHDVDVRPLFPRFEIPLTGTSIFKPDEKTGSLAVDAAQEYIQSMPQTIFRISTQKFPVHNPVVYVGAIASGDQFISQRSQLENLKMENINLLAIEMEGAAVAQVCEEHTIPYNVIRTISDKANYTASADFNNFIQTLASVYSTEIAERLIKGLNNQ